MSASEEPDPAPRWWEAYNGDGTPHVEIVHLKVWMAEQLLGANPKNRHLDPHRRDALAGAITRGEWVLNNDAIVIGADNHLDNGQHRCAAVIEAGQGIDVTVFFNAAPGAEEFMDQGAKRSLGDVLTMRGELHAMTLAAIVKNIFWWEYDRVPVGQNRAIQPTIPQLLDVLDRHLDIRDSIVRVGRQPLITKSFAACHHYIFATVDSEDADEFFRLLGGDLAEGETLGQGHPIHTLRKRLLTERLKKGQGLHTSVKSAFLHRTWHAWRNGEKLRALSFRAGGTHPSRFPIVAPESQNEA